MTNLRTRKGLPFDKVLVPQSGQFIYKDECLFCFDSPTSQQGLNVCMKSFLAFCKDHVLWYNQKTGNSVFLNLKRCRKLKEKLGDEEPPMKQPTRLAIGLDGGFTGDDDKYEWDEHNTLIVLPDVEIKLPDETLPDKIQLSVNAVLAAPSAARLAELAATAGTWDGEARVISKHAENLHQLPADGRPRIPPTGWKCEQCDLTSNLWLNLTDGSILCGRKFWDGTGGNNHAVEQYAKTKYPLAVKLGTITADGTADVFSYEEDDMVLDPHLERHMAHWGINLAAMKKTEKSMAELEIELNSRQWEVDLIEERGKALQPLYGQGYTGLLNLGNSCYINSVLQTLFVSVDGFAQKYLPLEKFLTNIQVDSAMEDFGVQMSKLAHALTQTDKYSMPPPKDSSVVPPPNGIRPQMFKSLLGKSHPEFATKHQQDAHELLMHLLDLVQRNCRTSWSPLVLFRHKTEERTQCQQTQQVRYTQRDDLCLSLPIPLELASNRAAVDEQAALRATGQTILPEDVIRPRVAFMDCVRAFAETETLTDFLSSATNAKGDATKITRLATFPDYLFVQMRKFTVAADWSPRKLDVSIDVDDFIDLGFLRGTGVKDGEVLLPEADDSTPKGVSPEITIDSSIVSELVMMGFPDNASRKAVYKTNNAGLEAATNWVMEHMDDPGARGVPSGCDRRFWIALVKDRTSFAKRLMPTDFNAPFEPLGRPVASSGSGGSFVPVEDSVSMIVGMGFTREQAIRALQETDNNIERAADWIFSHAHELDSMPMAPNRAEPTGVSMEHDSVVPAETHRDGSGKYELIAFISHMGSSAQCGHYVCHLKRPDGMSGKSRWVLYNDEKVAVSEAPPRDLAYIYLFKRL